jgi:hypothetical protein
MKAASLAVTLASALVVVALPGARAQAQSPVIASCDFEGPYSAGEQQIQEGCGNNWQWGRKDMLLQADKHTGRPGTAQMVRVRGIASGGMQFFYTKLTLKKDRYYRISYWLKSDGLEGPVRCYVRQVGYPWTVYVYGGYEPITPGWQECSFTGKCPEDVPGDVGVCWEGGSLGTIWLDDLKVEESTEPFPAKTTAPFHAVTGNMLPRSSFEGRRDRLWSMGFFGWNRDGIWEGVEADWEDPQLHRAAGGKVGRYCLAVPSAAHAGQGAAMSTIFDVLPGKPYTVSAWMKADRDGFPGSIALLYWWSGRHLQGLKNAAYPKLTTEWQRVSFTNVPEPPPGSTDTSTPVQVMLQIAPGALQKGTVYVDGLQFEQSEQAPDYQPASPLELYADVGQDGGNLIEWGQKVPLNLLLAAADQTTLKQAPVVVTVTGYPKVVVWKKTIRLTVNKETLFSLDIKRHGLFRVDLQPVDPKLAAPQQMLFALVPPIRNTGERGMLGTHIALRPFLVSYIRRLGFTWTRLHDCSLMTKWFANEPEQGKLQWHDEVAKGVRKGGINLLGLPDSPPQWAKLDPAQEGQVFDVTAYEKYCEAAARHYRGQIDYWELWNEPYMGDGVTGPEPFGAVMQAGYAGIKRGSPGAKVLGWCADVSAPAWGAKIPAAARQCLDIFSFHSYPNSLCGGGTLPFAAELPEHKKLWPPQVTECWNTEGTNGELPANSFYPDLREVTPEKNDRAAAFASRVWIEHAKQRISKFFVYQMHNTDTMAYHGGYQSLLIGYDRTPTPAAIATATTAYCMDGLECLPCVAVPGVVQGLFSGGGRATWAVYDDAAVTGRKRLNLTALPPGVEVRDVMGNDPRRDGRKSWEIGIQPLFVMTEEMPAEGLATACQSALIGRP